MRVECNESTLSMMSHYQIFSMKYLEFIIFLSIFANATLNSTGNI